MSQLLVETISAPVQKKGNRWKVVIAVPGKGQSGIYHAEMLREQGPAAFPAGTKAFIGHDLPQNRNARDQFGRYPEGAYYDDNFDIEKFPEGVLVAELEVFDSYKSMIEDIGTDAELSLAILDYEKTPEGVVTNIYPHRANSVDLVAYGGLEGAGLKEKLYESYSIPENNSGDESGRSSAQNKEEGNVNFEEKVLAMFAELNTRIDTLATGASAEAIAKAQADADAKAEAEVGAKVDEALSAYEGQVAAIDAAEDLIPSQVESLKAEARKGVDVKPLIESYVKTNAEIKATLTESFSVGGVRLSESATGKTEDYTLGAWNN
jgi:hypothetical protein